MKIVLSETKQCKFRAIITPGYILSNLIEEDLRKTHLSGTAWDSDAQMVNEKISK